MYKNIVAKYIRERLFYFTITRTVVTSDICHYILNSTNKISIDQMFHEKHLH